MLYQKEIPFQTEKSDWNEILEDTKFYKLIFTQLGVIWKLKYFGFSVLNKTENHSMKFGKLQNFAVELWVVQSKQHKNSIYGIFLYIFCLRRFLLCKTKWIECGAFCVMKILRAQAPCACRSIAFIPLPVHLGPDGLMNCHIIQFF